MTRTAVEDLSLGCLDTVSVNIDWSERNRISDGQDWYAVETFDYKHTTATGGDVELVLGQQGNSVTAAWLAHGRADATRVVLADYDADEPLCVFCAARVDGDESGAWLDDTDGDACPAAPVLGVHEPLTAEDLDVLREVEGWQWGAEGPMMNYHYGLGDSPYGSGRGSIGPDSLDEIDAAYALHDLSMCLVLLDDEFVLALTGGGMDMTWTIVGAFVALGYLPPVRFCRPPGFGHPDENYLLAAMRRSLTLTAERAQHELDRFDAEYPAVTQPHTDSADAAQGLT